MSNRLEYALHHVAEARNELERVMRQLADHGQVPDAIRLLLAASWGVRCAEIVLHEVRYRLENLDAPAVPAAKGAANASG